MVHDYAGHPFQVGLSRALAARGHVVVHAYFAGDPGPKGALAPRGAADPVRFLPISIGRAYDKGAIVARQWADVAYGRAAARAVAGFRPDVVISGNTPTAAQAGVIRGCRAAGAAFVLWVQDFYSLAVVRLLGRRLGPLGAVVGAAYRAMERWQFGASDGVVVITEDFRPLAEGWARAPVATIENWGALDEIWPGPRDNGFAREFGLREGFNFVYSGTLGMKHDPSLLLGLAAAVRGRARVVVVGQGSGMERLAAAGAENLRLLPLQPVGRLREVLAAADVAVAVIEPDAGEFSVPSKVQSYLCAGRPVLLAAPAGNLAARVVRAEAAGVVVEPGDAAGFAAAGCALLGDAAGRAEMGARGRRYAERAYDVGRVADRFEEVLVAAARRKGRR
ncbi:glycosyltransferase [Amaricoccus sp.]|uniref:glycosyltransferase n=1 Tax=Amaricoccus sp. TaxID=1872485 RepID=UPI002606CEF4|nr:glycosyltransferase [Amaricoccus sp.]HRO10073.1 glycosyltransferase [Amaricoccus sp.]